MDTLYSSSLLLYPLILFSSLPVSCFFLDDGDEPSHSMTLMSKATRNADEHRATQIDWWEQSHSNWPLAMVMGHIFSEKWSHTVAMGLVFCNAVGVRFETFVSDLSPWMRSMFCLGLLFLLWENLCWNLVDFDFGKIYMRFGKIGWAAHPPACSTGMDGQDLGQGLGWVPGLDRSTTCS